MPDFMNSATTLEAINLGRNSLTGTVPVLPDHVKEFGISHMHGISG